MLTVHAGDTFKFPNQFPHLILMVAGLSLILFFVSLIMGSRVFIVASFTQRTASRQLLHLTTLFTNLHVPIIAHKVS